MGKGGLIILSNYKYTEKEKEELLKSIVILIDSREQNNKWITDFFNKKKISYKINKLDYGDYSFYITKNDELNIPRELYFSNQISIERKMSLEELSGNFSQQRDRFEKEFSLYKGKMHLLIENANYEDICTGNYKTEYNKKSYLGSLHSFANRYNINIMFMPNNQYSGLYIWATFYYYLRNLIK